MIIMYQISLCISKVSIIYLFSDLFNISVLNYKIYAQTSTLYYEEKALIL